MVRKRSSTTGKFTKSVALPAKLKKQLQGPVEGRVDVTSYDVPKVAVGRVVWWRRWLGLGVKPVQADQWADLRSRVMDELKVRQGEDGVGLTSSAPFVRPLLPELHGRPVPAAGGDWLFRGFVLASLAAIGVLLMMGGRSHGPEDVLARVYEAWENKDVAAMVEVVDMPAVTADVVGQVYGSPVMDVAALPLDIRKDVKGTPTEVASMVKVGLAEMLEDDIAKAVARGDVGVPTDSLLGSLWHDMGGSHVEVSKPHVVRMEGDTALAEVMLTRDDSHQLAEVVQLSLAKRDGRWHVVGLPNFAHVAARLNHVETQIAEAESVMTMIEPASGSPLRVSRVEKETNRTGKVMKVNVEIANTGDKVIQANRVKLVFADALGKPLRIVELTDNQPLAAGMRRTRVLPIPVDRADKYARWVAELPLTALTVQAKVVAVR